MRRTAFFLLAAGAMAAAPAHADQVRSLIDMNDELAPPPATSTEPGVQPLENGAAVGNPDALGNSSTAAPAEPVVTPEALPSENSIIVVEEQEGAKEPAPTPDQINAAAYEGTALPDGQSAQTASIQILLDRGGVSPGVIDGYNGDNVSKAIRAYEKINKMPVDGVMDDAVWAALLAQGTGNLVVPYTITEDDFIKIVPPLPNDYAELAKLDWLGYTSIEEKLAERFHMDQEFLRELNPGADFNAPGTQIWVADTGAEIRPEILRIVADKSLSRLLAYDSVGDLVLSYPVTIGGSDTPSPKGDHEVLGVAMEPTYSYNPENFVQGDNTEQLTLPPGPNGPVGIVWIDLSEPSYGIHGTPAPDKIGKTSSHGCIRLTNWDATELAHAVKSGVSVTFTE